MMQANEPIIIEQTYNTPAEKVWQALTDNIQMKKWYFDLEDFKPEPGFKFQFEGGTETQTFLHLCEVTEAIPEKKLTYSWRYNGYAGNSFVTFELFPEGEKTRLKLTHAGLETFPASEPAFAKANFVEGWNHISGISLKEFLEAEPETKR
ncbi:SRPBCC family protein [Adhaeribacter terreus]|uniref:SRPBCC domain-containing protein n=1 Tax=Adhaeribacter terreus TaxID=529703 RepID=A0ABW0E6P3_9BACT